MLLCAAWVIAIFLSMNKHTHTYTRTHILRIKVANALSNYTTSIPVGVNVNTMTSARKAMQDKPWVFLISSTSNYCVVCVFLQAHFMNQLVKREQKMAMCVCVCVLQSACPAGRSVGLVLYTAHRIR